MAQKLRLGENHRRAVSVLLRGLEQMCDEIERCFQGTPGLLRRVADDLSPVQRAELQEMTERVRGEIRRIISEIELDTSVRSPRRTIRALLSASIVNLEESEPKRLRGYGPLSKEAEDRLGEDFRRLLVLLEEMAAIVERR